MKVLQLLASASLAVHGSAWAQNLIAGGGFEAPGAPPFLYLNEVTPIGWTGLADVVSQGYGGAEDSGDGLQWLDLNPGTHANGSGLSQTIALSAGQTYTFSFLYNGGEPIGGWTTAINFSISGAGSTSGAVSTGGMNVYDGSPWALYSTTFAATASGPATVLFVPNGVWAGGFIDAVSVTASTVPETGTAALLLLGLAGLPALLARRLAPPNPSTGESS